MGWYEVIERLDGRRFLRRWVFTVHGTFVSLWDGPPADTARALSYPNGPYYIWQPVNYPAQPFPMGKSNEQGIAELSRLLNDVKPPDDEFVLIGYSQGAMVTSDAYKLMLDDGPLARHLPRLKAAVTFGNPMRELGVANGNTRYGWPTPKTNSRGIAGNRLVNTPDWWLDFVNPGDMYTETPDDDTGEFMTMVYNMVQDPIKGFGSLTDFIGPTGTVATTADPLSGLVNLVSDLVSGRQSKGVDWGKNTLIEQIGETFSRPVPEVLAMFGAIINGIKFVATPGGPTYPHISYDIGPAVDYLNYIGVKVPIGLAA